MNIATEGDPQGAVKVAQSTLNAERIDAESERESLSADLRGGHCTVRRIMDAGGGFEPPTSRL